MPYWSYFHWKALFYTKMSFFFFFFFFFFCSNYRQFTFCWYVAFIPTLSYNMWDCAQLKIRLFNAGHTGEIRWINIPPPKKWVWVWRWWDLSCYACQKQGGKTRLPKFKFFANFPIGLHMILQIQIKKFKNGLYLMWKNILTENPLRFNIEPPLK